MQTIFERKRQPLTVDLEIGFIGLNLKLVLYLEDLANPNNGLNLVPNCL